MKDAPVIGHDLAPEALVINVPIPGILDQSVPAAAAAMTSVSLKNKDGQFVQPDDLTFAAAAAGTDWSKILWILVDQDERCACNWP